MTVSFAEADERALLGAAEFLAESASLATLRRRTVEILPSLVHTNMVAWNEVDVTGKSIDAVVAPELDIQQYHDLGQAFVDHIGEHPVIAYQLRTADGRPHAISDFMDSASFHATGIYQDFYRVLGAEDQLSFTLPDPLLLIGIALNRARRGFSDRDRRMCNLLRPHLLHAYSNVCALARVQRLLATLDHLTNDQGEELVIMGHRGEIEYLSPGATELLQRFFGYADTAALSSSFMSLSQDANSTLTYRRGTCVLLGRRVAIADGHALLLSEHSAGPAETNLRRLGLTTRESEVLKLIGEGLQTKQIAARLGVSPRTVDKHVGRSLDKLGVRTRLAAVQLLSIHTPRAIPGSDRLLGTADL